MSSRIGRVLKWLVLAALVVVAVEAIARTNPLTGTNSVGRATKERDSSAPRREPVQLDAERPLPKAIGVRAVMPLAGEVVIADKTGLLTRLRTSAEGPLTTVAELQLTGEPVSMSREDDRLYVAASWGGAYQVSTESTMTLEGHWQTSALSRATAPFEETVLVADWNAGVAVLGSSDAALELDRRVPTEGHASDVVLGTEQAYLADFEGGLVVLQPRRGGFAKVGRLDLPAAVAADVVGGAVFVADQIEGVSVVDASDPEAPVALSTVKVDGACATLDASDEWVAVGDDDGVVTVFARLPDGTLQEWYRIDTGDAITDVALDGDIVWFADGRLGRASLAGER